MFLSNSFPKIYGHKIGEQDGDIVEINVLDKYLIGTLEDETHEISMLDEYENIEEEEFVKAKHISFKIKIMICLDIVRYIYNYNW